MQICNKDEALRYIDTKIRQSWLELAKGNDFLEGLELGDATIQEESQVAGHTVWQFHIDGLPMTTDARKRWLLDTGETIEVTVNESENTLEKAYNKLRRMQVFFDRAEKILGVKKDDLALTYIDGVGARVYEQAQGGRAVIVGDDGGVLLADSLTNPEAHIQAYKDGQRTVDEDSTLLSQEEQTALNEMRQSYRERQEIPDSEKFTVSNPDKYSDPIGFPAEENE